MLFQTSVYINGQLEDTVTLEEEDCIPASFRRRNSRSLELESSYRVSAICKGVNPSEAFPNIESTYFQLFKYVDSKVLTKCDYEARETDLLYSEVALYRSGVSTHSLCYDQFSFLIMNATATYEELQVHCQKLQGTLLSTDDIKIYKKELSRIDESCRTEGKIITWIEDEYEEPTVTPWCSIFTSDWSTDIRPCYHVLKCGICKFKTSLAVRLYGELDQYDRNYTLISKPDGSFFVKGQETSLIRNINGVWTLQSNLHKETCTVDIPFGPFLRLLWKCKSNSLMLALSTCPPNFFACSSGKCLPESYRCDGAVQCHETDDKSDEEDCRLFVKDPGYDNHKFPPPRWGEEKFEAKYEFRVYSIADIKTSEYAAMVDLEVTVAWEDSRLELWNPVQRQEYDCKDIWTPKYAAVDTYPQGHYVFLPDEFTDVCLIVLQEDNTLTDSDSDPYMGKFI